MNTELKAALDESELLIRDVKNLVRAVLSGKHKGMSPPAERIDMRPVLIKGKVLLQVIENDGRQATTKNQDPDTYDLLGMLSSGFSSIHIESLDSSYSIRITKKGTVLVNRQRSKSDRSLEHDRQKNRLLDPSDPYLLAVGISDADGRVKPSRQDKYRQVEEFLRLLVPTLNSAIAAGHIRKPTEEFPLRVVDLGCGNAYLTFAVHQYLQSQSIPTRVTGVDIRVASRERNVSIAKSLGISDSVEFVALEISKTEVPQVDLVIALHACDTATDDAISWAVNRNAKLIMVAPCCHHDLQVQLTESPEPWKIVTKNGLLKERFADILTDALRAQILKMVGYRSEVIEFVGDAHTPRNLMIRAVKTNSPATAQDRTEYKNMIALWNIRPALSERLESQLKEANREH